MEIPRQIQANQRHDEPIAECILRLHYTGSGPAHQQASEILAEAAKVIVPDDFLAYYTHGITEADLLAEFLASEHPENPNLPGIKAERKRAGESTYSEYPCLAAEGDGPTYSKHVPQAIRAEQYPDELLSEAIIRLGKANKTHVEQAARKLCLQIRGDLGLSVPMNASHVAIWLLGEWRKPENHQTTLL